MQPGGSIGLLLAVAFGAEEEGAGKPAGNKGAVLITDQNGRAGETAGDEGPASQGAAKVVRLKAAQGEGAGGPLEGVRVPLE